MSPWISYGIPAGLLLLSALLGLGRYRPARLPATFLLLGGVLLFLIPLFPGLEKAVLPNKIRLFMGGLALTHMFITLEALRRNSLKERYALLWLGTGIILILIAIQPDTIGWLVSVTGMHYTSAVMLVVFVFLLLIAFHVSLVLSSHQNDRRVFTQELALLQRRIEELEKKTSD
jgi:hypothetical protein